MTKVVIKNNRNIDIGSLKINIPNIAVPAAPIPAHTAYAVPIGILFNVLARQEKLNAPNKIKRRVSFSFVKPLEYFNARIKAISKMPAITKM